MGGGGRRACEGEEARSGSDIIGCSGGGSSGGSAGSGLTLYNQ